jgi:hypothetical protein
MKPPPTFTDYESFVPAFTAARKAAIAEFGPNWHLHPQAFIWARLPIAWVRVRVAGGIRLPDAVVGSRWSTAPRDQRLPVARFWPGGELPIGPEYAMVTS